jgi:hypothetical protein
MGGRTKQDFIDFLAYLGEKGLIPQNTAIGRKAAAIKVFSVLSDAECADMTKLDIDEVMVRFENRNRGKYTTDSLRSYQSRLRNSLQEFSDYCENPLSFRPRRRSKSNVIKKNKPEQNSGSFDEQETSATQAQSVQPPPRPAVQILPVALRPDLTIQIAGLPFDLTKLEAQKLANIILAHALPDM